MFKGTSRPHCASASSDDAKRKAAEQKLDKTMGEDKRKELQDQAKQAKGDPKDGDRKLDELAKDNAEKMAGKA